MGVLKNQTFSDGTSVESSKIHIVRVNRFLNHAGLRMNDNAACESFGGCRFYPTIYITLDGASAARVRGNLGGVMADSALTKEVRGFFEEYSAAFEAIDGNRIAALYHMPTVTMRGDGSIHCLQSRDDLAKFFQGVADTYYREGSRTGSFKNFQVLPIGGRSALATMDWDMRRGDGTLIREWRQSYNVVRVGNGWQILVSTFHVQ